ncbi:MAG: PD-(D/E)XK nuclease family protein, partial [bacterium]|nr:PD-(D/E)XK nuclease family protein [bacterium]
VSRFEKFQACPFSYYASYGLRLKKRSMYRLEAPEIGTFLHSALDRFADEMTKQNLDWGKLDESDYNRITKDIVADLAPHLQGNILDSAGKYRHIAKKMQATIERSAKILGKHAEQGSFRPVGVEIVFGGAGDFPALVITLADGSIMEIAGRIDRLDIAEHNNQLYMRVIDYKSGRLDLTPLEIFYGLKIQLILYLDAGLAYVEQCYKKRALPTGAFYFRLHHPLVATEAPLEDENADKLVDQEYTMRGFFIDAPEARELMERNLKGKSLLLPISLNIDGGIRKSDSIWTPEQFEKMRLHTRKILKDAGQRIIDGNIDISPIHLDKLTACKYCEYFPVCQLDSSREENKHVSLLKLSSAEVWQTIGVNSGGGV